MNSIQGRAPAKAWSANRKYAVIIDAGSSGSRVQVYSWLNPAYVAQTANATLLSSLPRVEKGDEQGELWMKKIHPGISSFVDAPDTLGHDHLKKLYKHALKVVPSAQVPETPVYLLATAGMRLLTQEQQSRVMHSACRYTKEHTKFLIPECDSHFQVITGETEGLYGWIAINYLLGTFDYLDDDKHHTYGFLDMGGASAQIAYIPAKSEALEHASDLTLLRLRTLSGVTKEWRVFVSTWLGFGANEARRRYASNLIESHPDQNEVDDPCMPKGLVESTSYTSTALHGTGDLNACLTLLEPLLGKDAPCPDAPCLFAGVHAPRIDFDVNHFIGISEYYYSAQDVFGLGGAYDYQTLSEAVKQFCSRNWSDILDDLKKHKFSDGVKEGKLQDVCFKASWMMNVLHDGIGVPRVTKEISQLQTGINGTEELQRGALKKGFDGTFNSAEDVAGTEISWTLGKVLLYASSSVIAPSAEPVGFGPNLQDASTFHMAGELKSSSTVIGAPAVSLQLAHTGIWFISIIILFSLLLLACRRRFSDVLWRQGKRKIMGSRGEHVYERVLENGDTSEELELSRLPFSKHARATFSNGLSRTASQLRLHRSRDSSSDGDKLA